MHHELVDLTEGVNRHGYPAVVWVCSCGRRGSGSRTVPEAQAGFLKHFRGRARAAAGYPTRRRRARSRDW